MNIWNLKNDQDLHTVYLIYLVVKFVSLNISLQMQYFVDDFR